MKALAAIGRALKFVWQAARRDALLAVCLQAVAAVGLGVQVFAGRRLVELMLHPAPRTSTVVGVVVLVGLGLALTACSLSLVAERQRLLSDSVGYAAQRMTGERAARLELQALETPSVLDLLSRVQMQAQIQPLIIVAGAVGFAGALITSIGLFVVLLRLQPIAALVMAASLLPGAFIARIRTRVLHRFQIDISPDERLRAYYWSLLTAPGSAKEMRALGLRDYILARFADLYRRRRAGLAAVSRHRSWLAFVSASSGSVLAAGVLVVLVLLALDSHANPASTIAAAGTGLLLMQRLATISTTSAQLLDAATFFRDYHAFLALDVGDALPGSSPVDADLREIELRGVDFTYPGSSRRVLEGIDLTLRRGEVVAIVGENGAGKTTLAKLLCRLYDSSSGTISWNGTAYGDASAEAIRGQVSVIFQDFEKYMMSAADNIAIGAVHRPPDMAAIREAAIEAGCDDYLGRLPQGYDTPLSRSLTGGTDLSIGQWQRVALARAFYRDAPLVIMDEPTASLDPLAEQRLFETARELFRDRLVVLISHRFSTVRLADRIVVLEGSRIAEQGTHDELLALGGLYRAMYEAQAAAFGDTTPDAADEKSFVYGDDSADLDQEAFGGKSMRELLRLAEGVLPGPIDPGTQVIARPAMGESASAAIERLIARRPRPPEP